MPIASAIQRGSSITVYDEKNRTLFGKTVPDKTRDGIVGYTANSISIRYGNTIIIFNATGHQIGTHYSPR